jgi:hypothetical protein
VRQGARRRWFWLAGILALLIVLTYGAARFTDEPLRRYMQQKVNERLTGYTAQIQALHVHPWTVSFHLENAAIFQDANPDPPVADIARLTVSLDWRALVHRRIVADITFDRPTVYVDLRQVRAEAKSNVPLKEKGWQEALEALAFDLKINRLRVQDGNLTYVDRGPFKPLRLSRLQLDAENIRNIRSPERVYPSSIHLEAAVFDAGRLWVDGQADFLAEPHVGVQAAVNLEQIQLDYFKPITNRYNVGVRNGSLSLAGSLEYAPKITRLMLERVLVEGVEIDYIHSARTAEVEKARAQETARAAKEVANKPSVELRIERLDVVKSTFGFVNQAARPPYRIVLTDTDLSLEHLGNQRSHGPAVARVRGRLMGSGETRITAKVQPQTGSADVDLTAQIERVDLASMKDLVRAYGGVDVAAGEFSLYSELRTKDGALSGYVKPLFRGVKVGGDAESAQEKSLRRRLYEGLVNIAGKILKNRARGEVATVVTLGGRVDQPQFSQWQVVGRLLQNAFVKAILPGYEEPKRPKGEQAAPAHEIEHRDQRPPDPGPPAMKEGP